MTERGKVPSWAEAPTKSGRYHLHIRKERGNERLAIESRAGYLIGRNGKECDILCEHKTCSRVHACIAHHPSGRVYVVDLGSVHGTFIDGKELEPRSQAELKPGKTVLGLGSCPWEFRLQAGSAPAIPDFEAGQRRAAPKHSQEPYLKPHGRREAEPRGLGERRHDSRSYNERDAKRRRHDEYSHKSDHPARRRHNSGSARDDNDGHHQDAPCRPQRSNFSSADPAGIVRGMAGPPAGAAPMTSAEQKKKLLWGNKGAALPIGNKESSGGLGANRWDTAQFENDADKQKFIKLMGAQKLGLAPQNQHTADTLDFDREGVLTAEQQNKVLGDVEGHFMQGLRRADGRKVGLGL